MRSLRQTTPFPAWPSLRDAHGRLLGLPFVLTAFTPGLMLGWQPCLAALTVASLATFLVYLPLMVLALNRGYALADNAPVPLLTLRAYAVLLALWTTTAWLGAAFLPLLT